MEIAEPFSVFAIREVLVGPVVDLTVPVRVLFVSGQCIGKQSRDDRFVLRPPEFHIVPILLNGQTVDIDEVPHAAVLTVPTTFPHPIEHLAAGVDQNIVAPQLSFFHDEPRALNRVAGI